jgi:hypothetical protein
MALTESGALRFVLWATDIVHISKSRSNSGRTAANESSYSVCIAIASNLS